MTTVEIAMRRTGAMYDPTSSVDPHVDWLVDGYPPSHLLVTSR